VFECIILLNHKRIIRLACLVSLLFYVILVHANQFSKFQQFNVRIFDIFDNSNKKKLSEKHIKVIKNNVKCCKTNHLSNKIDFRDFGS